MTASLINASRRVVAIIAALGLLLPSPCAAQADTAKTWKVKDDNQRLRLADGSLLVLKGGHVTRSIPIASIIRVTCEKHTEQPIPGRMKDSVTTITNAGAKAAENTDDAHAAFMGLGGASVLATAQAISLLPFWFWKSSRHVVRISLREKARNGRNQSLTFRLSKKDTREVCSRLSSALRENHPGQVETAIRKAKGEYYWYQAIEERVRPEAAALRQRGPARVIDLSHLTRDELFRKTPSQKAQTVQSVVHLRQSSSACKWMGNHMSRRGMQTRTRWRQWETPMHVVSLRAPTPSAIDTAPFLVQVVWTWQ